MLYSKKNIEFKIKNVLEDLNEEFIKNIKIVMIDIDHYGSEEQKIIDKLYELNFSGIILLDDIFYHPVKEINKCMKNLWDNLSYEKSIKYDITEYGHWSGTGIILMNTDISLLLM